MEYIFQSDIEWRMATQNTKERKISEMKVLALLIFYFFSNEEVGDKWVFYSYE